MRIKSIANKYEIKEVFGFPGYQVSTQSEIIGKRFGKPLAVCANSRGYVVIVLHLNGVKHSKMAHRLVAEAFIPNLSSLSEVNHKNGNKLDNCVANLEWCTHSDNVKHAYKVLGKELSGCATPRIAVIALSKLTNKERRFESIHEAACELHLHVNAIWRPLKMGNAYGNDRRCSYIIRRANSCNMVA